MSEEILSEKHDGAPLIKKRFWLLSVVLFCLLYTQAPLYYSNQNQYFLHGFRQAGMGLLQEDWLANTLDPTPIFSSLVAFNLQWAGPAFFYLIYACIMGAYVLTGGLIFRQQNHGQFNLKQWACFFGLFCLLHSAILRWLSFRILGNDYPWYFQCGVAGQYLLGGMFQPSTFGTLALLGIAFYSQSRPWVGTILVCLAGILHSTYLLAGAFIILGFQADLAWKKQWRKAITLGLFALALVMPSVIYVSQTFKPTDPDEFKKAQEFLVHFRLPHHCLPGLWIDWVSSMQIGWMVLAIAICRGTSLGIILGVTFSLGAILTLAQVVNQSNTLALLFPWRISAMLVPISTMIILARLVRIIPVWKSRPGPLPATALMVLVLALAGVGIMIFKMGYRANESENNLLAFIHESKRSGDQYLIPIQIPNLAKTTRGSLSSDFRPSVAPQAASRIIPIDMQRFRLATQAPLYIDFKSIPYQDSDVLEWHHRLMICDAWYKAISSGQIALILPGLKAKKITHLVSTSKHPDLSGTLELVYRDDNYLLWKLPASQAP